MAFGAARQQNYGRAGRQRPAVPGMEAGQGGARMDLSRLLQASWWELWQIRRSSGNDGRSRVKVEEERLRELGGVPSLTGPNRTDNLLHIRFCHVVLHLPTIAVNDSTECMFLNLMVFERLHPEGGNDLSAFVFVMDSVIRSSRNGELLSNKRIIRDAVGGQHGGGRDVKSPLQMGDPNYIYNAVNSYYRSRWRLWDI
uniref:Uncharacterized protein n=1 Tax=Oryza punctata TaxID=4537 RepID=A0A0E0MMD7_ORYPU